MKNNRNFFLMLFLYVLMAGNTACAGSCCPEVRMTLRVMDYAGRPVEGARAAIGFIPHSFIPVGGFDASVADAFGMTDAEGLFAASGVSHGESRYSAIKEGYYETTGKFGWRHEGTKLTPWNPTVQMILRKIMNPVPMYVKNAYPTVPRLEKPCGFDLEKGDWTEPYGKGKIADMIFRGVARGDSWENFEKSLEVSFSNEGDGIQTVMAPKYYEGGSKLRLPHTAPEAGYQKSWSIKIDRNTREDRNRNFVFRVRSRTDGKGNVISAMYGKINGDFEVGGHYDFKKVGFRFTYYLNPDGTGNIEFDPKRNLIKHFEFPDREVNEEP